MGLLFGNGNHCDYFVGELRKYSCSKSEILNFYRRSALRNPISGKQVLLDIVFVDAGRLDQASGDIDPSRLVLDMVKSIKPGDRGKRYYVVYILDVGYPTRLDMRCL